jgi:UDP-N-acetylmuramate dehydrogenase
MISQIVAKALQNFVPEGNLLLQEPLQNYTTFRVGGPADAMIAVEDIDQLQKLLRYLNQVEIPYFVMGRGSNILVSDKGYPGVILTIGNKMNDINIEGTVLTARGGTLLSSAAKAAYWAGLSGLEFASGIPGTIGGGTVMNAGAYGGECGKVITEVEVMDKNGNTMELDQDTMEFGYRTSAVKNQSFIITKVTMNLTHEDPSKIKTLMDDLAARRREKQPLEYPSAGSTFKRPVGAYAGELIMKAGLAGFSIGGAQVSEKHCGFIINRNQASAKDIYQLMIYVQETVENMFHIRLEPEVILLGDFS